MRSFDNIKSVILAGLGKEPCDLRIRNVKLVNVFSAEVYDTDIYVKDGRIVSIEPGVKLEASRTDDGCGRYAMPGFVDTHMHFETTMLTPEALAEVMVPHGTTTICADLMEIANVAGGEGMRALLTGMDKLPYRLLLEVPSRVPTAPGLETTGAILGAAEVKAIMEWEESVSLGELDPSKLLFVQDEYLHKVADTLAQRKIVNGHAIGRMGQELNVYASAGISDDHECVTAEEMIARLRLGLCVLVREGSTERNVDELMRGVLEHGLEYDNLMFCTDDKHPTEIRKEGHINYNVNRSIALGVPPMKAIQMASINAARHFRREGDFGSLTPGRCADIILSRELTDIQPERVYSEGRLVAEGGKLLHRCPVPKYPDWILHTVTLKKPITAESFALRAKNPGALSVQANVMGLYPVQIINEWLHCELPVRNGLISSDIAQDIVKLAVVERYGKTGGVGVAFVKNFGLPRGALAFSTSHDHHNIVCVGALDVDLAVAANAVAEMNGGMAVVENGRVMARMPLPIGGLMSDKNADEVLVQVDAMNKAARALGCPLPAPFMTLSFISLPTVPALGLTDKGLVDVLAHTLISVERDGQ